MELQSEMYEMGMLMDFYGSLLTDSTLQVLDMYYNQDMSLAEIGEVLGISRQGVHSFVTKGKQQLTELERKLGLYSRFRKIKAQLEEVRTDFEQIDRSVLSAYEARLLDRMHQKVTDVIAGL